MPNEQWALVYKKEGYRTDKRGGFVGASANRRWGKGSEQSRGHPGKSQAALIFLLA